MAWLEGVRHEPSIEFLRTTMLEQSERSHDAYEALLVYDLQREFMTPDERRGLREVFLDDAEAIYEQSKRRGAWFFSRRLVNNWTYRHAASALPRLLLPGIMFRSDRRADALVDEGLKLYGWLVEANPNNGTWSMKDNAWEKWPTLGEPNDEIISSPNGYGIYAAADLTRLNYILAKSIELPVTEYLGRSFFEWFRYYTYALSFEEGINFENNHNSFASYIGSTGHGTFEHLGYHANTFLLAGAMMYDEPVFAWHYYANPSPTRSAPYFSNREDIPDRLDYLQLLWWGHVIPKDPVDAGWPLSAFWENAGVGIIRKSWDKKGPGSGVVWLHSGAGASHIRPCYGTVQYHADDHVILGSAPSSYNSDFLTHSPETNSTLFVDGEGQTSYYSQDLEKVRLRHGKTEWLGPDTFAMDMSPRDRSDFLSAYEKLPVEVHWTRKVHYIRERDVLYIKDVASTADGDPHEFRFNWVTDAKIRGPSLYELPGGYVMVAQANTTLRAGLQDHLPHSSDHHFSTLRVRGEHSELRVWWAIAKDERVAREVLARMRGPVVTWIRTARNDRGDLVVRWRTDEPSIGSVEYGPQASTLEASVRESAEDTEHSLTIPNSAGETVRFRVVALDSHGDATVGDDEGRPFVARPRR